MTHINALRILAGDRMGGESLCEERDLGYRAQGFFADTFLNNQSKEEN